MYITEILAEYAYNLDKTIIQPVVFEEAKKFFSDGLACMVGAISSKPTSIAAEWVKEEGCKGEASVIGFPHIRTSPCNAAFVNGISAHYLDYDDVSYSSNAHVSAVIVPTVLAVGEACGSSGIDMLTAYVTGVEVIGLLGRLMGDEAFKLGWHTTSLLGIFGATAAASKLFGLNKQKMTYAFGLAASEASGNKGNFGTMAKAFHAGSAASKGIRCAQMASLGYDSNPGIFEAKCGFLELTVKLPNYSRVDNAIRTGTSEFLSPGMVMKPYPCCKAGHNGIDAVLKLVKEHDLKPEDIRHVEIRVQAYAPDTLRYSIAKTTLEGRFSMNYGAALAILKRKLTLDDFLEGEITDKNIIEMMERIDMVVDESLSGGMLFNARGDTEAYIYTNDGRKLHCRVNYAAGDPKAPMSEELRIEKVKDCFRQSLNREGYTYIFEDLNKLEQLDNVQLLINHIQDSLIFNNCAI